MECDHRAIVALAYLNRSGCEGAGSVALRDVQFEAAFECECSDDPQVDRERNYHPSKRISMENPGPIPIRRPYSPGWATSACIRSSSMYRTEAEERFPISPRLRQERASAPSGRASALSSACRTLGPPVCAIQCRIDARWSPYSARNKATSPSMFSAIRFASRADSTILKPLLTRSQPRMSSVPGYKMERVAITRGDLARRSPLPMTAAAAPSPNRPDAMMFAIDRSSRCRVSEHSSTDIRTAISSG